MLDQLILDQTTLVLYSWFNHQHAIISIDRRKNTALLWLSVSYNQ